MASAIWVACLALALSACGPTIDDRFPPGDPTVADNQIAEPGDNPVVSQEGIASESPGVETLDSTSDTNYLLLTIVAVCLIVAGALLVRVERWQRDHHNKTGQDG